VAGSEKSTIGRKLASAMNCAFLEGDALHSSANIDKMGNASQFADLEEPSEGIIVDASLQPDVIVAEIFKR
jgi:gluconate kinase